jgi:hypothetical protein
LPAELVAIIAEVVQVIVVAVLVVEVVLEDEMTHEVIVAVGIRKKGTKKSIVIEDIPVQVAGLTQAVVMKKMIENKKEAFNSIKETIRLFIGEVEMKDHLAPDLRKR